MISSISQHDDIFRSLFESSMDAIIAIDATSTIVLFNLAASKLFGLESAEAIGSPIERFIPSKFSQTHRHHIQQFGSEGTTTRRMGALGKIVGVRSNNQEFEAEASISLIQFHGEKIFTAIIRDISEKMALERALRFSEAQNRALIESFPDLIFTNHKNGQYLAVHLPPISHFYTSPTEFIGKSVVDVMPKVLADKLVNAFSMAIDSNVLQVVRYAISLEDEEKYFEIRVSPIDHETVISIFRDVSSYEAEKMEDMNRSARPNPHQSNALRQLTKTTQTESTSLTIVHELSQPITTIFSNAQAARRLIANNQMEIGDVDQVFQEIIDACKRSTKIIEQVQSQFSKKEALLEAISITQLVHEVAEMMNTYLVMQGITLSMELTEINLRITANKIQLQQLLINILTNACEAMIKTKKKDKIITIQNNISNTEMQLSIADQGTGIPESELSHVFTKFYSTKDQGMGIGLHLCKEIVENFGGTIWCKNNADGGATFFFTLPLEKIA